MMTSGKAAYRLPLSVINNDYIRLYIAPFGNNMRYPGPFCMLSSRVNYLLGLLSYSAGPPNVPVSRGADRFPLFLRNSRQYPFLSQNGARSGQFLLPRHSTQDPALLPTPLLHNGASVGQSPLPEHELPKPCPELQTKSERSIKFAFL